MSFSNWQGINRWEETKRFMGGGEDKERKLYILSIMTPSHQYGNKHALSRQVSANN